MNDIGHNIIRLERVDSTNQYIKERATELPNGTVVIARDQIKGRGRQNKQWISLPDKSLTFSFLLKFHENNVSIPFLHHFPAVAVVQCLSSINIDAQIKWPNDILLRGRKIGGLLVQANSRSNASNVIIGIGLNVLQDETDLSDLREKAASIFSVTGRKIDLDALFQNLLAEINSVFVKFQHPSQWPILRDIWCEYCAHFDQKIIIFQQQKSTSGIFIGLDENGFAVMNVDGKIKIVNSYDTVSLREKNDTRD